MIRLRIGVLVTILAALGAPQLSSQSPDTVDYQRDVQPIFRDNCYGCHGPEQQMNGFRLDRRADALRGGSQAVIGPGNANGSKLYHRLVDATAGARMPPTRSLQPDQIRILKTWIDQGVQWPDELSGETPAPPVDPSSEALADAIRRADQNAIDRAFRDLPRVAAGRAAGGTTALMYAALYGDAALIKRLIVSGADPNASNAAGATALMWAVPHIDRMNPLIAAGADVNARSQDGRTPLLIAAGVVGARPAVQLLLENGAVGARAAVSGDFAPLREAARVDDPDIFRALLDYGADPLSVANEYVRLNCYRCAVLANISGDGPLPRSGPVDSGLRPNLPPTTRAAPVLIAAVNDQAVHAAVERSLPLLQRIGEPFIQKTGCVSCHHDSLVAMAVAAARKSGYAVDERADLQLRRTTATYLESWRERTLQNRGIAGTQDTISYLLVGLAASGHPADEATDAQALWLMRQAVDGRWPLATLRPPIESNDIAVTALTMRAIQLYPPRMDRTAAARAVERAAAWLLHAQGTTTEERALKLLGLVWSQADATVVRRAAADLRSLQASSGGWSQEVSMDADAYATGEALVALQGSGLTASDPVVRRGIEFLVRSQLQDGSWYVPSRSVPIQAYFESGFPHGADQWISAAATAWAVTALAPARLLL
jgi:mono/diheme cytochrome c family protein